MATTTTPRTTGRKRSTGSSKTSGSKSASSKTTTTTAKRKTAVKKVDQIERTFTVERMPAGKGGVRFGEVAVKGQPVLFGHPYMDQDAFNSLGLKEGDSIEVVVRKAA